MRIVKIMGILYEEIEEKIENELIEVLNEPSLRNNMLHNL